MVPPQFVTPLNHEGHVVGGHAYIDAGTYLASLWFPLRHCSGKGCARSTGLRQLHCRFTQGALGALQHVESEFENSMAAADNQV
jgi:hypothetical protein